MVCCHGGGLTGVEVNGNIKDVFSISLTMFLFDRKSKERWISEDGKSLIEFVFQREDSKKGHWIDIGLFIDEWGEWDDVQWE